MSGTLWPIVLLSAGWAGICVWAHFRYVRRKAGVVFPYRIVVELSPDDGVYVARVPAFPGLAAHGDTPEAAAHEARLAAEGMLAIMADGPR